MLWMKIALKEININVTNILNYSTSTIEECEGVVKVLSPCINGAVFDSKYSNLEHFSRFGFSIFEPN